MQENRVALDTREKRIQTEDDGVVDRKMYN